MRHRVLSLLFFSSSLSKRAMREHGVLKGKKKEKTMKRTPFVNTQWPPSVSFFFSFINTSSFEKSQQEKREKKKRSDHKVDEGKRRVKKTLRTFETGFPYLLGPTHPCPNAVRMEPFSASVFKVPV